MKPILLIMLLAVTSILYSAAPTPAPHVETRHVEPHVQSHPHPQPKREVPTGRSNIVRTPSMSRIDIKPERSFNRNFNRTPAMNRAELQALHPGEHEIAKPNPSASVPKVAGNREQTLEYLKKLNPIKHPSTSSQPLTKTALADQKKENVQKVQRVQNQLKQTHPDHGRWFTDSFFEHHHVHPIYHHQGYHWWHRARWRGVAHWLNWGWNSPIDYDDQGEGSDLASDDENADDTEDDSDVSDSPQGDWIALGVFEAGKNTNQAAYSNLFVQLAVNKDGDIAGTFYNASTDQTHELSGAVDPDTQQVAWTVTDNPESPMMTTGIYNLTQNIVPVQVHFQNGTVQNWVLARVNP